MEIAVINKRCHGSLFHYAHFLIDCLYPEIINNINKYKTVYRIKNINQTLGNFSQIYEEVMQNKNIEITKDKFDKLNILSIIYPPKEHYSDIKYITKFRKFIFDRYNINPLIYIEKYPEVILIKRGNRIELIDDIDLKKINTNITTGKERREIQNIDMLEEYLNNKYTDNFLAVYLEFKPFEEQIKLFNNAKLIIMAHGAAISSILFCKEETKLIEITCGINYEWFNVIFPKLKINRIKIENNNYNDIIKILETV